MAKFIARVHALITAKHVQLVIYRKAIRLLKQENHILAMRVWQLEQNAR